MKPGEIMWWEVAGGRSGEWLGVVVAHWLIQISLKSRSFYFKALANFT